MSDNEKIKGPRTSAWYISREWYYIWFEGKRIQTQCSRHRALHNLNDYDDRSEKYIPIKGHMEQNGRDDSNSHLEISLFLIGAASVESDNGWTITDHSLIHSFIHFLLHKKLCGFTIIITNPFGWLCGCADWWWWIGYVLVWFSCSFDLVSVVQIVFVVAVVFVEWTSYDCKIEEQNFMVTWLMLEIVVEFCDSRLVELLPLTDSFI